VSTKKEDTRLRLLEAAETLLLERGFHHVSLDDIAAAAGVTRQAVYKSHFTSKADLVLALARHTHVARNLDELVAPVRAAKDADSKLEETIRAIVLIEVRVHDIALVLSAAATSDDGAAVAWRDRLDVKRAALREALDGMAAEGRLAPEWTVEEAVDLLAALCSVETYEQLIVDRRWEPETLVRRIWQICRTNLIMPHCSRERT
jgi:AcrR family transcriptional regulator